MLGAPDSSRGQFGLFDVVESEGKEKVFDAVVQTSALGEEQQLGQKMAEISLRRGRQGTKKAFSSSDLA